jgi:GNAT superfamily N-acetyltransferase
MKNIKKNSQKISSNDVKLRDGKDSDTDFILNSWAASYRGNAMYGAIPKDIYFKHYRKFTVSILSVSKAFVACNPENEDQVYGYIVYRFKENLPIISYLYVKQAFRHFGIAEMLIKNVSHETKVITHLMPKLEEWLKSLDCIFNPFIDSQEYYEIRC